MGLYLPNRVKYGVNSAPGTGTITLGTLVAGFLALPSVSSGTAYKVAYFVEDTISGSAVCEVGDGTLTYSGTQWTLTRNVLQSSSGVGVALSLTSAALVGFTLRAGDFFSFYGGFVNKFRNGNFDIWQRGTSLTVTTSGAYTADGWIVTPTGASVTVSQDSTRPSGADNLLALKIAGAASVTAVNLVQRIESYVAAPLANQLCTVKFKVYNSTGSTITPTIKLDHASAVDNFGTVSNDLAATNLQSCANGAWTDVAYSFTAGANVINGMQVTLGFGAIGSGSYVEVTGADIRITPDVATGLCNLPPFPELRPIHQELAFCKRYLRSTYGNGVTPGTATRNGLAGACAYAGSSPEATTINYGDEMRAPASVSYWDGAGNASRVSIYTASAWTDNLSGGTFGLTNGVSGFTIYNLGGAGIPLFHYFASAEL